MTSQKDFTKTFKQSTDHKGKDQKTCQKLYLELVIIKDTIIRIKTQGNNWGKLFTKCTTVQNLAKMCTHQPCNVKPREKKTKGSSQKKNHE